MALHRPCSTCAQCGGSCVQSSRLFVVLPWRRFTNGGWIGYFKLFFFLNHNKNKSWGLLHSRILPIPCTPPLHMLCLYIPECSCCSHCLITICLCAPEAKQRPYYADYSPLRLSIHTLCTSHYLDLFITIIICINVFTMSIEHYNQPQVTLTEQHEPFPAPATRAHDSLVCMFCSI